MRASRRLAAFLRPYWRWVLLAPLLMILEVSMDLMQPRLVQVIVDRGIARGDWVLVLHVGLLMVGVALTGTVGGMGCSYFAVLAGQGFGADLRQALFEKIQSLSFGNLDDMETGPLITRLTNDVGQTVELVMIVLRIMVRAPLLMIGGLIMAVCTSAKLSLLFFLLMPLVLGVLLFIVRRIFPVFSQVQKRIDALNTVLQENLAGVRVVKAFARAEHEVARFGAANDALMANVVTAVRWGTMTQPLMMLILNTGIVLAVWIGGMTVIAGGMQVGQVIAFVNYLMMSLFSLLMVSMLVIQISRAEASAVRVLEVLDSAPRIVEPPCPAQYAHMPAAPRGRLAFEQVSFSYDGDEHDPVLKNISFTIEPGETVALLGATGAGKSSLAHLIPRFYDVTAGRVTLDGVDVRELPEATLRARVGIAMQESVLFSGTIRDNIRYSRPDAADEEVIAAAHIAQAHEFIMEIPEGYDALVGQRGVNLSGGQKQRLSIARAVLAAPAVLVLDDSTSAVDVRTEEKIHTALAAAQAGQTRLIVAQRISTVLSADKILVLDDGMIAAEGTHAALLAHSPIYQEIYHSQVQQGGVRHG